jgi:hypothetical protein
MFPVRNATHVPGLYLEPKRPRLSWVRRIESDDRIGRESLTLTTTLTLTNLA